MKVTEQLPAVQACLADLEKRHLDELVVGINTTRQQAQPFIRLSRKPDGFQGVLVRRSRRQRYGRTMAAVHMGCQLRWEEAAS